MSVGPFEHSWLSGLFHDEAMAEIWSSDATLKHMLDFESAWIEALHVSGLRDVDNVSQVASCISSCSIDVAALRNSTARDGVPIPNLVAQLQSATNCTSVHAGATSQDVIDTALVLVIRNTSDLIDGQLSQLEEHLTHLEDHFGDKHLMGRTRMQAATGITVKARLGTWREPITSYQQRLIQLRSSVERVQIGGASGNREALGEHSELIVNHVARALSLAPSNVTWHAMRGSIVDYASWLSLITGSIGKMGQDILLMSQQGIDEISLRSGGSSSAMQHKKNPVLAELLVTLARFNAVQVGGMHHAMIHEQERSGSAWMLEWMILPQMAMATGRALSAAIEVCQSIESMG